MIENWVRGTWNTNIRIKVFLLLNLALTPLLLAPTAHEVIFWIILLTIRPNFDLNINTHVLFGASVATVCLFFSVFGRVLTRLD